MLHSTPANALRIDFESRVLDCFLNKSISLETKDYLMWTAASSPLPFIENLNEMLLSDPALVETTFKENQLEGEENSYEEQ